MSTCGTGSGSGVGSGGMGIGFGIGSGCGGIGPGVGGTGLSVNVGRGVRPRFAAQSAPAIVCGEEGSVKVASPFDEAAGFELIDAVRDRADAIVGFTQAESFDCAFGSERWRVSK